MLPVGGLTVNVCATVQKLKRPACGEFSIPSGTRGYVTSGFIHAQNSGTIRATRPLGRGTVCPRIDDSRLRGNDKFMIYDLKAEGSQVLDCGFRIADWRRSGRRDRPASGLRRTKYAKQSQWPAAGHRGGVRRSRYPSVPLFYHSTIPSPSQVGQSQRGGGRQGQSCGTNPIRTRGRASVGQAPPYCAKQTQFGPRTGKHGPGRSKSYETKPSARWKASGGDALPTKRGAIVRSKPNLGPAWAGPRHRWAKDAKRTQFAHRRAGTGRIERAKQSQTGESWGIWVGEGTWRCLSCKTNPIARSGAPRRCRPWRPSRAPLFHHSSIQSPGGRAGPGENSSEN
jgi:hypothetical protein